MTMAVTATIPFTLRGVSISVFNRTLTKLHFRSLPSVYVGIERIGNNQLLYADPRSNYFVSLLYRGIL